MTTEGFWPGEAPAVEQEHAEEREAPVAEPLGWPQRQVERAEAEHDAEPEPAVEPEAEPEASAVTEPAVETEAEPEPDVEESESEAEVAEVATAVHVPGELDIPDGVAVLEGSPSGAERTVGVVVSRFNGELSNRLLESALEAPAAAGVPEERATAMPVPAAFELRIGAMPLAKTRRCSCCV